MAALPCDGSALVARVAFAAARTRPMSTGPRRQASWPRCAARWRGAPPTAPSRGNGRPPSAGSRILLAASRTPAEGATEENNLTFYDDAFVKLRPELFFVGARIALSVRRRQGPPAPKALQSLRQLSIFSPLTLPSPGLGQCEGRKNAAPPYHRRYPANDSLGFEDLAGGFRKCWDHPTTFYPCRPSRASHSLLHAPTGDPGKPGRSPPI